MIKRKKLSQFVIGYNTKLCSYRIGIYRSSREHYILGIMYYLLKLNWLLFLYRKGMRGSNW